MKEARLRARLRWEDSSKQCVDPATTSYGPAVSVTPLESVLVKVSRDPGEDVTAQDKELPSSTLRLNATPSWSLMVTSYGPVPGAQERAAIKHCGIVGTPRGWGAAKEMGDINKRPHVKRATQRWKGMNMENERVQ